MTIYFNFRLIYLLFFNDFNKRTDFTEKYLSYPKFNATILFFT